MRRVMVLLTTTMMLFAACFGGGSADEGGGVIRLQVSGEVEELAIYEALVTAFEQDHPDIDVKLVGLADKDDHLAKLTTAFATGDPPEVFLINFREYSQYVAQGAVEPVGPFLEDAGVTLDDYFPQPIEAFTLDEQLQCMPQNVSSLVVYYNKTLFENAGLARPSDDWDWDDFRTTARALTKEEVKGLGIEPNVIRIAPFVWSNGGEIVDDADAPARFTLDEPEAREALEYIVSLVRDDRVVPTEQEIAAQDLETRFGAGKLGMLLSSRKDTPVFREVSGLDFDVAPLPTSEQRAGILHSDAYCIAADIEAPDDAWSFIEYATGKPGQTITALGGRTVPALMEVARSSAFLDPVQPPKHSEVFLDGIDFIRRTPVIPTWPEIEDEAEEILTRAFYEDGYTIDDALADLEAQTTPLFEEAAEASE